MSELANILLPMGRIMIAGLGKTGLSLARFMKEKGYQVYCTDDKLMHFPDLHFIAMSNAIENLDVELLAISPGIRSVFQPHPLVLKARDRGIPIVTDLDIMQYYNHCAHYIGITGTNGKSTTSAMLHHTLQYCRANSTLGGNIGIPMLNIQSTDFTILELSSYQLENTHSVIMHSAAILNVTQDHIEHHGNMNHYIAAKERILQQASIKIFNHDNDITRDMAKKYPDATLFSSAEILPMGLSILEQKIYQDGKLIGTWHPLRSMHGSHNVSNAAAVLTICQQAQINIKLAIEAVNKFPGLPHRNESIISINNITFVNDSKATNLNAGIQALSLYKNVYLIAGGVDKNADIICIGQLKQTISQVFLIGEAQDRFYDNINPYITCQKCTDLERAVSQAYQAAKAFCHKNPEEECVILLSPMCSSFDQYSNFEERGEHFRSIAKKLCKKINAED